MGLLGEESVMATMRFYPGEPEATLMRIVGPHVYRRARAVQFAARGLAGRDTGHLVASIKASPVDIVGTKIQASVSTDVSYAMYNHDGVGLWGAGHPICAKTKPYLVFWIGGRKIVTKCVRGYPGTHFLIRALKEAQDWPVKPGV